MANVGVILSKTAGVAAMGLALYDGVQVAKAMGKHQGIASTQKWLENGYYRSRTIDDLSATQNATSSMAFDIETKATVIPSTIGKIKGSIGGFFYGLGVNLPLIATGSLALLGKGFWSKCGGIGTLAILLYSIARQGFGLGKPNPME